MLALSSSPSLLGAALGLLLASTISTVSGAPTSSPPSPSQKHLLLRRQSSSSNSSFVLEQRLGNLSPYFTADHGLVGSPGSGMPDGCEVTQVNLMHRHGSRFPLVSELPFIQNLSEKVSTSASALDAASLPSSLSFLQGPGRWSTSLGHDNLTAPGRRQLFDHGVQFKLDYQDLALSNLVVGVQDRVIESASWFRQGYFGRYSDSLSTESFVPEDNLTISYITPMDTCPLWEYSYGNDLVVQWGNVYLPPITARLNGALQGALNMSDGDTHGALYSCAYELAAYGNTTWCEVFENDEIADFEYELDLLMRGAFGYGLPGDMGPLLGSLYVSELVNRLTSPTSNASYAEFGHDTTIDMFLTALGLANDTAYPASGPPSPDRNWRTSSQVPFAAQSIFERWNCSGTEHVRFLLNGSPFPLAPVCDTDPASGGYNETTGACTLDAFVQGTAAVRNVTWGDAAWNATCGNPGF